MKWNFNLVSHFIALAREFSNKPLILLQFSFSFFILPFIKTNLINDNIAPSVHLKQQLKISVFVFTVRKSKLALFSVFCCQGRLAIFFKMSLHLLESM